MPLKQQLKVGHSSLAVIDGSLLVVSWAYGLHRLILREKVYQVKEVDLTNKYAKKNVTT